ncbi:hypothetical protein SCLCIDRAFT_1222225 [Scleroderma citrinum Foug A]|uniref:Uncharacterized protein n=1 Tax=Scleroderma citrinum Foug A TaxID=1036808 RepID=A0A0C2YXC8_9AGAM|nr:hypothetical protein SCLCIDRAFT_1222225 [Scleroderma citrinum Foug A]
MWAPINTTSTAKVLPPFYGDYSNSHEPATAPIYTARHVVGGSQKMQLALGGFAEDWYSALPASDKVSLATIRVAFLKRWP